MFNACDCLINVCRLCVPNIMKYYYLMGIFLKKFHTSLMLARLLDIKLIASKFALLSVSNLKDKKVDKKANLHEN